MCNIMHYIYNYGKNKFPKATIKIHFHVFAGFPNVIGAIDYTHLVIKSPFQRKVV